MPSPAASTEPRLSFHRGLPLPVRLFGLALFGGGVAALWQQGASHRGGALVMFAILGLPGLILAAGAAGATIDVRRRRVRAWRGLQLLVVDLPLYWRTHPLEAFRVVVHTEEQWYESERSSGTTVYPVYLESWRAELGGASDSRAAPLWVLLCGPTRFDRGRATAERVAKALGLGVLDERDRTYRPPGTLDQPLAERLAGAAELPAAQRPVDARSRISVSADRLQIDIPAPGVTPGTWGVLVACLAAAPALVAFESVAWAIALPVAATLALLVVVFGLLNDLVCERAILNADELAIQRGIGAPRRTRRIRVRELEELSLTSRTQRSFAALGKGSRVLAARSDRRTVEFGFGLSEEEQRWLLDVLRARLGLPRRPYR